jgi:hypothetical protein
MRKWKGDKDSIGNVLSKLYPQYPVQVFKTRWPETIVNNEKMAGMSGPSKKGPDHFLKK